MVLFESLQKKLLRTLWTKQYPDYPFEHTNIRKESWRLMKFNKNEFDESIGHITYGKGGNLVQKLDSRYKVRFPKDIGFSGNPRIVGIVHYMGNVRDTKLKEWIE